MFGSAGQRRSLEPNQSLSNPVTERVGGLPGLFFLLVVLLVSLICIDTINSIQPLPLRDLSAPYAANSASNLAWMMLLGSAFTLIVGANIIAAMFRYPVPLMVVLYIGLSTGIICSFFLWYYGAITSAIGLQLVIALDLTMLAVVAFSVCLFLVLAENANRKIIYSAFFILFLAFVFWSLDIPAANIAPYYTLVAGLISATYLVTAISLQNPSSADPQQNVAIALACYKLFFTLVFHLLVQDSANTGESAYAALPTYAALYWLDLLIFSSLCLYAVIYHLDRRRQRNIQVARLAQRAQELSPLISNSRHELRSPLADIIGLAELVGDGPLDQQQRRSMLEIQRTARNGLNQINRLFSFRQEPGQGQPTVSTPFSLAGILRDCVQYYSFFIFDNNREVIADIGDAGYDILIGDPEKVRQLFVQLLEHLLTVQQANEILVRINCDTDSNYTIAFDFSPNQPEDLQVVKSSAALESAILIAGQANGDISIDYDRKEISLHLPMQKQRENPSQQEETDHLAGKNVLVLDDNTTSCQVVTSYLERWKINTSRETEPVRALARIHHQQEIEEPVDLVIVDFQMPDINGADFILQVLQDSRISDKPDFIIMSNTYPEEKKSLLKNLGVSYILEKPVMADSLRLALIQQLGVQRSGKRGLQPMDVLLIEDNEISAKLSAALLKTEGMQVEIATTGETALTAAAQQNFDIVVIDCNLPDIELPDLVEGLSERAASVNSRSLPLLIALSADDSDSLRSQCHQLGITLFLAKPLSREKLGEVVDLYQTLQAAH